MSHTQLGPISMMHNIHVWIHDTQCLVSNIYARYLAIGGWRGVWREGTQGEEGVALLLSWWLIAEVCSRMEGGVIRAYVG